jgi:hypothetical protein
MNPLLRKFGWVFALATVWIHLVLSLGYEFEVEAN